MFDGRTRPFYPPIEPFNIGRLLVDDNHRVYFEESGNPKGLPVLFLHGGPGAGAAPTHRRFFDPERYRIIIHDQRGAGRSTPLGSVEDNTTDWLIQDIESLRERLGIEAWVVFGGSWGSTLALAYGAAHPERCLGFILRGVFFGSEREIDWVLSGMGRFFPDAYDSFAEHIPPEERWDLMAAYHKRLFDPDPKTHMPAAIAWSRFEAACSTLRPSPDLVALSTEGQFALGMARIEWHYFHFRCFRGEGEVLAGVKTIRHLPCTIVQGRYDMVCPFESAYQLHKAWPRSELYAVDDAGHAATEPGTRSALIHAADDFAVKLG